MCYTEKTAFVDQQMKQDLITYTVEVDGDTYVVEDVPVRVDETTGEPFFAPDTVDKLQAILEWQMEEREDAEWKAFAYRCFAAGYDDDEPDYSLEDIKHPPPPDEPPA
jgi:hypothetical protein